MHARMFQMKTAEAAVSRQMQDQRAAEDAASSDAARLADERLRESQQQVRVCRPIQIRSRDAQYCVQVKALERLLSDSTQQLQQLQLQLEHSEEQAAKLQTQTSERVQRLQALHAEALNMKQQEVITCALMLIQFSCAIKFSSRCDLARCRLRHCPRPMLACWTLLGVVRRPRRQRGRMRRKRPACTSRSNLARDHGGKRNARSSCSNFSWRRKRCVWCFVFVLFLSVFNLSLILHALHATLYLIKRAGSGCS